MNNKIPCGGFYLSDTLGVDENGKLGVNGGEPYKSLVTDGEGNAKWADRAFYSETKEYRLPSNTEGLDSFEAGTTFYKVSSDIPDVNTLKRSSIYSNDTGEIAFSLDGEASHEYDDSEFHDTVAGCIIVCYKTTINLNGSQITVPSTGIYLSNPDLYLKLETVKKIDEKFIPDVDYVVINSSTSGSSKKFKITVNDSGTISATEV